jgi:hypothetical protein
MRVFSKKGSPAIGNVAFAAMTNARSVTRRRPASPVRRVTMLALVTDGWPKRYSRCASVRSLSARRFAAGCTPPNAPLRPSATLCLANIQTEASIASGTCNAGHPVGGCPSERTSIESFCNECWRENRTSMLPPRSHRHEPQQIYSRPIPKLGSRRWCRTSVTRMLSESSR